MTSISPDPKPTTPVGNAELLDGVTGRPHPVAALVETDGLRLIPVDPGPTAPQCPLRWPWNETYRPAAVGGRPVFATKSAVDARLTVKDGAIVRAIERRLTGDERAAKPGTGAFFSRRPTAALAIAATVIVAAVLLIALAPISAGIARLLPADTGAATSDEVILHFAERYPRCEQPEGRRALQSLSTRLAGPNQIPPPVITVLDWPLVNAFAMPGRRVVLTSGLILDAQGPSEIAAVLAHEIAHGVNRDPMTKWVRDQGISILFTALFGVRTTGGAVDGLAAGLLNATYTRAQEAEADQLAISLLRRAGIEATGGAAFFERLAAREPGGTAGDLVNLISTHPGSAERASLFRSAKTGTDPGLTAAEWEALRQVCGDEPQRP